MPKKGIFYPIPDKYKFSAAFASNIKPIISSEKDKYLSLASSAELKKYLPDIDLERNYDLLAFAGNLFVANKINLNDDGLVTKEAIAIAESFPFKFLDLNHDRTKVLGCILTASFTEFGTDKPLKKEDIKDTKSPFNITIGGIIWRIVNQNLADAIETLTVDSNAEEKIALSWEVAFSSYDLVLLPPGKNNIEDGKIISDASEISKLEGKMKCFGGKGITDEGYRIGRIPKEDVLGLGAGLTESPAAEVGPIVTNDDKEQSKASITVKELTNIIEEKITQTVKNEISAQNNKNSSFSISHSEKLVVNEKDNKNFMKITTIKDINDENLKEAKASDLISVFDTHINKINEDWLAKEKAADKVKNDYDVKIKELEAAKVKSDEELNKVKTDLDKLVKASEEKDKQDKFSARMENFDNEYDLTKEDREILASDIKDLDDEDYNKYNSKMAILLAGKKKGKKVKPEDETEDDEDEEEKNKTIKTSKASADSTIVEDAIDKGKKDKTTVAATTTAEETESDKYKKAFGPAMWTANTRKPRL